MNRTKFCENCPNRSAKEKFKARTLEFWKKRLGKHAAHFRFDEVLSVFYNVIGMENLPKEKISVKSQILLDAYIFEKNKAEAIKEFNKENS